MTGFTRRIFVASVASTFVPVRAAFSNEGAIDLSWKDLRRPEDLSAFERMRAPVDHSAGASAALQPPSLGARVEWDDQIVRVSGFVVPIERTPLGIKRFILASFVPPCLHVPPPAANQMVMVSTDEPYTTSGPFEVVAVTGRLKAHTVSEGRSEISYVLEAAKVERLEDLRKPERVSQAETNGCTTGTSEFHCLV